MGYTPTQGIFVNGHVADAYDILNEFNAISTAFQDSDKKITTLTTSTLNDAKRYTDHQIGEIIVDGGTF